MTTLRRLDRWRTFWTSWIVVGPSGALAAAWVVDRVHPAKVDWYWPLLFLLAAMIPPVLFAQRATIRWGWWGSDRDREWANNSYVASREVKAWLSGCLRRGSLSPGCALRTLTTRAARASGRREPVRRWVHRAARGTGARDSAGDDGDGADDEASSTAPPRDARGVFCVCARRVE